MNHFPYTQNKEGTMSFGKRLKSLLAKKRQSQMDFALRLGITRSRLCNYINDRSEPDYATLCTIAEALQVSVDYLLGRNGIQDSDFQGSRIFSDFIIGREKPASEGNDGLEFPCISPVQRRWRSLQVPPGGCAKRVHSFYWRIPPALRHHRR